MSDRPPARSRVRIEPPRPTGCDTFGVWVLLHEEAALPDLHRWIDDTFHDVTWVRAYEGFVGPPKDDSSLRAGRAGVPGPPP